MPIANQTVAKDAIYAVLKTAVEGSAYAALNIIYPDSQEDKPVDKHLRVYVDLTDERQVSIGGTGLRRYRVYGLVTVQVFTEFGKGEVDADAIAGVVKGAFRGVNTGADAITFRHARVVSAGQDGSWLQTNVTVEFDYDELA
jgi:hypothetical protein